MDALSEALSAVHMTGAIFYSAECTAPWGFAVPAVHRVAHLLAPGTERLVNYHLVMDGRATVRMVNVFGSMWVPAAWAPTDTSAASVDPAWATIASSQPGRRSSTSESATTSHRVRTSARQASTRGRVRRS